MNISGFDAADVIDEAVQRSGGQTATGQDVVNVRRSMKLLLERWNNQGFNTWKFRTSSHTVAGNTTHVTLDDCVDDVFNVNSVTIGQSESPMRRISPHEYAQLTTKLTKGQPSMYYLDRDAECPKLFFYPVGRENIAEELIVTYVERPPEFDRVDMDPEVPARWLEALIFGLALDLARKRPPYDEALIQRLKVESADAEGLAQRADRGRHSFRYRIAGRR
jgi:hypothetical protein